MKIDEELLNNMLKAVASEEIRRMMYHLRDDKLTYSELEQFLRKNGMSNGMFTYYLTKTVKAELIINDMGKYFLTNYGVQVIKLLDEFVKICSKFDMSDCDSNGTIKMIMERKY